MLKPINKNSGSTPGEKMLEKIAEQSFFGLWCYPSVHKKTGEGKTLLVHEIADLMVVFGDSVIFFSEKDIKFTSHEDILVSWRRWYKQSISKSVSQLRGAERYLKSKGAVIYIDKNGSEPLPLEIDFDKVKIYLVGVCRNSVQPAKKYFYETARHLGADHAAAQNSGTLVFSGLMGKNDLNDCPFHVCDFSENETFVHIFDERSIELLLENLSTATDFINYLNSRELFIRNGVPVVVHGEEDLLAKYFVGYKDNGLGAISVPGNLPDGAALGVEEGLWTAYVNSEKYRLYQYFLASKKILDEIINYFSDAILQSTVAEAKTNSLASHEMAIRVLASENVVSRARLGALFQKKLSSVPHNARSSTLVQSIGNDKLLFVFLFFPWDQSKVSYDDYRMERTACMEMYGATALAKYSQFDQVCVLGTDTVGNGGRSETIIAIQRGEKQSVRDREKILYWAQKLKILTDVKST